MSGKGRAAGHLAIYASSTMVRQMVGFLMLPIYTRFLTPQDYGVIALLSVMLFVFEAIVGARFRVAIPKYYYDAMGDEQKDRVVSTALIFTTAASALGVVGMVVAATPLSSLLFGAPDYAGYIVIYSTLIVTSAIEAYGMLFIRLLERPKQFLIISLLKLVLQIALNLVLIVYFEMGVAGVVISSVVSTGLFGVVLGFFTLQKTGISFDRALARRLFMFTWPIWISGLASIYVMFSTRYFLRVFSDLADVGLFELASKFSSLLFVVTWMPFVQWWQTERYKVLQREDGGKKVVRTVFDMFTALTVYVSCGVIFFSGPVIRIMSAPEFHSAVLAIPVLTFAAALNQFAYFFNSSFYVAEKTGPVAQINWLAAVVMSVAYFLLVPKFGFVGAGYAVLIAALVTVLVTYWLSERTQHLGVSLATSSIYVVVGILFVVFDHWVANSLDVWVSILVKIIETILLTGIFFAVAYRSDSTRAIVTSAFEYVLQLLMRRTDESSKGL